MYRSKIVRMKCSLNWSYINLLWRIELWLRKLQLSVFLKIVWVFWLERVVPSHLVIALNKLTFCYYMLLPLCDQARLGTNICLARLTWWLAWLTGSIRMTSWLAGSQFVKTPMSLLLGTNEVLASKHDIAKGQTKPGTLRPPSWFLTIFFFFFTAKGVKKKNIEISSWFKRWVQWCSCLRLHILVWVLLQNISDLIRLSRSNVMYELCFTCFKVEYKR